MAKKHRLPSGAQASTTHLTAAAFAECLALSGRARDQVIDLSDALQAYLALELFVAPEYVDETQARVPPSRAQLGALLNAINAKVMQKINALADITTVLQAQLSIDAAQAR